MKKTTIVSDVIEVRFMVDLCRFKDPAELVGLVHDFNVVLARVGKGGKSNERCADIIRLRYLTDEPMTQSQIGKRMGISGCRVQQLEDRAFRRLRFYAQRMGLAA